MQSKIPALKTLCSGMKNSFFGSIQFIKLVRILMLNHFFWFYCRSGFLHASLSLSPLLLDSLRFVGLQSAFLVQSFTVQVINVE